MWRRRERVEAEVDPAADALAAIEQFQRLINNADTKAGFMVAAVTVLVGAIVRQPVSDHLPAVDVADWIGLGLLGLSAAGGLAAAFFVARCLMPRVKRHEFSRFSWPSVARVELDQLLRLPRGRRAEEAWMTARALAQILAEKYGALQWGIRSFLFSAATLVVALGVLAF